MPTSDAAQIISSERGQTAGDLVAVGADNGHRVSPFKTAINLDNTD